MAVWMELHCDAQISVHCHKFIPGIQPGCLADHTHKAVMIGLGRLKREALKDGDWQHINKVLHCPECVILRNREEKRK